LADRIGRIISVVSDPVQLLTQLPAELRQRVFKGSSAIQEPRLAEETLEVLFKGADYAVGKTHANPVAGRITSESLGKLREIYSGLSEELNGAFAEMDKLVAPPDRLPTGLRTPVPANPNRAGEGRTQGAIADCALLRDLEQNRKFRDADTSGWLRLVERCKKR
jgi:hypothetical protein